MLSPACAPSVCKTKLAYFKQFNWNNTDCQGWWAAPTHGIKDGMYCKYPFVSSCDHNGNCDMKGKEPHEIEFNVCKEYYIDPIGGVPYYDFSEAIGVGLSVPSLLSDGRVYYDDLILVSPDQASPLSQANSQEVLFGSYGF